MAHQKWKLLQVTWLPRDTATWTGWSQMELRGGAGQKCEGLSFDYEGGHSRVTDIQPLHEHMFEPKPYFLSTFRDRQVFI